MKKQEMKEALETATQGLEEKTKRIEQLEQSLKYANEARDRYKSEIDSLHLILDGVDIAPRRVVKDESMWDNKRELSVTARFTGFCAGLIHRQFEPMKTVITKEETTTD